MPGRPIEEHKIVVTVYLGSNPGSPSLIQWNKCLVPCFHVWNQQQDQTVSHRLPLKIRLGDAHPRQVAAAFKCQLLSSCSLSHISAVRPYRTDLAGTYIFHLARYAQIWHVTPCPQAPPCSIIERGRVSVSARKWKWKSLGCIRLSVTPWTIQSMEFPRPEYWSG